jgi:threonine/homoserine/homoserine lactone efflux protein
MRERRQGPAVKAPHEEPGWVLAIGAIVAVIAGVLAVIALLVGVDAISSWVVNQSTSPIGLAVAGIASIGFGIWMAGRIVTGKSPPGTPSATKVAVVVVAALFALLGAWLLYSSIAG